MYQRIQSHTQVRHTHHQANMIRPMTEYIENQKSNDAIKKIAIGKRNATLSNYAQN